MKKGFPEKIFFGKMRRPHPTKNKKIITSVILIMIIPKYSQSLNFPRTAWKKLSILKTPPPLTSTPTFQQATGRNFFLFRERKS